LEVEEFVLKKDQTETTVRREMTYISQSVGLPPADILPIQKAVRRMLIRPARAPMSAL
jgi:hypothetical protein